MEFTKVTVDYDDVPELSRSSDHFPTEVALAACLKSLETDAMLLGQDIVATLIGAAHLALTES